MGKLVTIGLDIAKNVFQAHGVDAEGAVVIRKKLGRQKVETFFSGLEPCLVGIESCASSHHWARVIQGLGHQVRLMPPAYVKPYMKSQKNDAADAEAICEAVTRPTMRFVEIKSVEQQSVLTLHRTRALLIRHRTRLINTIRAHLAEVGIIAPIGRLGVESLVARIGDAGDDTVPALVRGCLSLLVAQLQQLREQVLELDRQILAWHRKSETSRRLASIPGMGPLAASALAATAADARASSSGRNFAASIGLVPRQNSSGGKERLGSISKRGDQYLRWLLVAGSMAVIRYAQRHGTRRPWLMKLLERRSARVAAVALANKIARTAWVLMAKGGRYREPELRAA
jgi:transposase